MTILRSSIKFNRSEDHAHPVKRRVDMDAVGTIILGGGSGSRLFPLTQTRCKPAVSFGGRYRLIDIPMSNALNSGCHKIYILTQFLSASLHQHILKTYRIESHTQGFVELLSAEQKPTKNCWYQGTADAIRQNVEYLSECDVDYFLILSGDQLYQMNYENLVLAAEEKNADLVIASLPVNESSAKRMGLLKINEDGMVLDFIEKPQEQEALEPFKRYSDTENTYLGSMGIYLFKKTALLDLLEEDTREDFGKHLIPTQLKKGKTGAYIFNGYWEDIGTIESFFEANLALTRDKPLFNLYDDHFPIHTVYHSLPPPKLAATYVKNSMICEGSNICADTISNSIIGPRSIIGQGTIIENSYLFGNDFYSSINRNDRADVIHFEIGEHCLIKKAIIDKQVKIGNHVHLINQNNLIEYEKDNIFIRDGVIIVTRGAQIPDHFII